MARPRLFGLLSEGAKGPLTLVAGPAGAGKTMLLGSWVLSASLPGPVAWVSLDSDDNDPSRFWAYLLAALRASGAVPSDAILATLAPPRPATTEAFVALLVNGLAELPGPMVVILDDVHELSDDRTLASLNFLIRHAPLQLRLVLAARADPHLPLARLRVAGSVTELRAAELAFDRAEAAELLAGLGLALSDAEVEALWARTEGWAAGLRLATLSLQHDPDPAGFVTALSGDDRAVADYLLEEVLSRQPAERRDFLLRTSVADRLTGGLADALTGGRDGARQLAELERTNAFVVPLDPQRTTYRYHQLFAELLRAELHHQLPQEVAELHRRAARWHAIDGASADAVRHAIAAEDWGSAHSLLVERWGALLAASAKTLRDLLAALPPDLIRGDPELAVVAAHTRLDLDDLDGADAYLRMAEANAATVPEDRRGRFAAAVALGRLHRARVLGDLEAVQAIAQELLKLAPGLEETSKWFTSRGGVRLFGLANLGTAALWSGDLEAAARHLEQGLTIARATTMTAGEEIPLLNCMSQLALVEVARGRLQQAIERGQAAVALAERRGWSQLMQAFGGYLALAWVHYQRDDLVAASRYLERASQAAHERTAVLAVALVQSWLLASEGRSDTGLSVLRAAATTLDGNTEWQPPRVLADLTRVTEARLLAAANTQAARALLAQTNPELPPVEEAVVLARLRLAEGDPAGAAATLAPYLHGDPVPPAHPFTMLEAQLVDAVAQQELGEHHQANRSLDHALALAGPEGYRRIFVDAGAPMRALLSRQFDRGTDHPALVAELLGMFDQRKPDVRPTPAALVDPLTVREQTVLRYLRGNLSAVEIASELYVSVNTVKSHIKSIYRKLEVNGRRAAVNRARQLGLL
jgi:LuxR family transcriptional regulator, maltose regulon positive regulatory protein